ncbi:hypothetical protein V2G26_002877 [Clonostachys chloroleuca]
MAELASIYHAQGRYDKDEEISVHVLDLRREVLGEKHPDTISNIADLAVTYHAQGRYDEAEPLENQANSSPRRMQEPDPEQQRPHHSSLRDFMYVKVRFSNWKSRKNRRPN